MSVVESIRKARQKMIDDKMILDEIRKQNPDKEVFFKKAEERGATAEDILNEIIKQNTPKRNLHSSPTPSPTSSPSPSPTSSPSPSPSPISSPSPSPTSSPSPSPSPISSPSPSPTSSPSPSPSPTSSPSPYISPERGKTVLTQEAQEREEKMRDQFLKRIEAKEKGESMGDDDPFSPSTSKQAVEKTSEEMTGNIAESAPKSKLPKVLMLVVAGLLFLGAFIFLALNFL